MLNVLRKLRTHTGVFVAAFNSIPIRHSVTFLAIDSGVRVAIVEQIGFRQGQEEQGRDNKFHID
jgi:hypothetical protein